MTSTRSDGPLLVYGPWEDRYDFGPWHPLTPRRFGPGIDLLRAIGATPGLVPEPTGDEDLLLCHTARYLEIVRRLGADPEGPPEAGIGPFGDCPPFAAMHEISAAVAGGSLRAMEAILRGDVEHAFHPGGGLHHAMAERASGFCIYDDPALAIALARRAGLRVLYLDFDTHHGDGVQVLHADDPGVLTFSIHESGRYLFPGTGFADELGAGTAAGSSINLPLEPWTGEAAWLAAISSIVPELAAAFGPDVIVSQHGCDAHAWDPLAHLRVTTTAMGEAARLVDSLAHRHAGGRWLATGGGGYDIYRVVPRAWALTWLAGAHRETPAALPAAWRSRWASAAEERGTPPLPLRFEDEPNAGMAIDDGQHLAELRSTEMARLVRRTVVPRLVREATDRGWSDPSGPGAGVGHSAAGDPLGDIAVDPSIPVTIVDGSTPADLARRRLAPRVIAPSDPMAALALLRSAGEHGAACSLAVAGDVIVGLVVSVASDGGTAGIGAGERALLAIGIAPDRRRMGLGRELLRRHLASQPAGTTWRAEMGVAERDWIDPAPVAERSAVADSLLVDAGFTAVPTAGDVTAIDRAARTYRRT